MAEGGEDKPVKSVFGQMYLEKFGYEVGQGLGRRKQGIIEPIRVKNSEFCLELNNNVEVDGCSLQVNHPFYQLMNKKLKEIDDHFSAKFHNLYVDFKLKCDDLMEDLRKQIEEVLINPNYNAIAEFSTINFVKETSEAKESSDIDFIIFSDDEGAHNDNLVDMNHDEKLANVINESAEITEMDVTDVDRNVGVLIPVDETETGLNNEINFNESGLVEVPINSKLSSVPISQGTHLKTVVCIHEFSVNKFDFHAIYSLFIVKHLNMRRVGHHVLKVSVIDINPLDINVSSVEEDIDIGVNYETEKYEDYVRKEIPDIYSPTHKLYVCNISNVVTKDDLKKHFASKGFCPLLITLMKSKNQSKQFAYVIMDSETDAIHALTVLHYSVLCEERMFIGFAPIQNYRPRNL
ncbi:PIN2/TERF1-interacting telomerase inhibitor 1 [Frankliniella fusca]|uniref:PIN2/TERF1-interacting telomerase inhibitor 1 n=1 Tax=Frankliniella fusca TaxID=407009 RepID=A0AAE1GTX1_9NEOP|nr:PIN2/TERF1-interacting telomerase inhibitor 1 [Frankliniella fusca]